MEFFGRSLCFDRFLELLSYFLSVLLLEMKHEELLVPPKEVVTAKATLEMRVPCLRHQARYIVRMMSHHVRNEEVLFEELGLTRRATLRLEGAELTGLKHRELFPMSRQNVALQTECVSERLDAQRTKEFLGNISCSFCELGGHFEHVILGGFGHRSRRIGSPDWR